MGRFKAILFDYDDTLVSSFPARVKAARKAADGLLEPMLDLERIMREQNGRPQAEIFEELVDDATALALIKASARWYWEKTTYEVVPFPGICESLADLKSAGLTLAVVTSKARLGDYHGKPFGAVVEMRRLGMDGLFDLVVGLEDVTETKPSPAPIFLALEKLKLDAAEALMVGDSHIDVAAASRASVSSAGATWGTLAEDLLMRSRPDYLIHSPAELRSVVA